MGAMRPWPRRSTRLALAALLTIGARSAPAVAEPERPTCRHWAVLLPEDAGQHRVYDGIRKGLELAQLERVCLKDVPDDEASFGALVAWHQTLAAPAPLVFAIGRRAGARLVAAGYGGPGVLVSAEVTAAGAPLAPEPALGPRMARVRAEVAAEVWGAATHDLLGLGAEARPVVVLAWQVASVAGRSPFPDAVLPFAAAAGLEVEAPDATRGARAVLSLRMGVGETPLPFEKALALARALRVPLLSDDPARFGTGATLLVVPDHQRAGRTAAEAARRLWRDEPGARETPLVVRSTEVWVDLGAAEAAGLDPPLPFLAGADRVKAPPKRAAPAPGAPR